MERKRAWIYCRTAYPDAHTLAMQQAHMEAFAEKRGFEVVGITSEHANGLTLSRRGLTEVSSAVDDGGVDLLLVTNLSRLGRNLEQVDNYLRWLNDWFVDVVCADGTVPHTSVEILHRLVKAHGVLLSAAK